MFDEIPQETFDEREKRVLNFWNEQKIFERSITENQDKPHFSFYDGPPFATGLPHYGHLLAGTIKDVVLRYKTMRGFYVPRRFGWDCHGLPVETEIEKAFNLSGAHSIEAFGIANFNEECRKIVLRYTEEWQAIVKRMGRWVDFDKTYHTMDLTFMESVWWVFKQLYELGLVYEGYKVMPFSARLGTPLSNFEAGENYKDVDDPSLTVSFVIDGQPNLRLLVWTTTPWTLVSNLAIMVGPDITYVKVKDTQDDCFYVLAKERLPVYYKDPSGYTIIEEFKGKKLEGLHYQPLFPYFADRASQNAFRVILEESVSTEEGTGLVHAAPAFGEVDFYACQKAEIPLVCPVDTNGRFTEEIPEYTGMFVKDADKDIIKRLKHHGRVIQQGTIHHRYPFCWRTDTPLIYKAVHTWFVAVEKIKEQMVAINEGTHWTPEHIKKGRFGKWLENARDWAISRNRYWGTPIPIWRSDDGELLVIGSVDELQKYTDQKMTDLHRHFIDPIIIKKDGKTFSRIPEVFDCWFESGSMPYAQNHYPFENQELFKETFPADFIGEGIDQTRGWFYTLTILSTALFKKAAFKNVVVNGMVLAADGTKMSKRLRNYPDPMEVVHRHGADAIRLYMMNSPAVKAEDLRFTETGVELVLRQVLIPLWNAYSFFITYARIYAWKPSENLKKTDVVIDKWMISVLNRLISQVEDGMDQYDLSQSVGPFVGFVDQLTNWYIRRSRRRFWSEEETKDRDDAFSTLYYVLLETVKIAAPFVPFICETVYQNLKTADMPTSVHLCRSPLYHPDWRDLKLEKGMACVQEIVSLGHALRKEHKLKVRQPLAFAHIACADPQQLKFIQSEQHLIMEELNVKHIEISDDEHQFVTLKVKPNFRLLGKKVGKKMPAVQDAIAHLAYTQMEQLFQGKNISITVEGEDVILTPEDVQVERVVKDGLVAANASDVTIALDTTLTEPLLIEGLAREIVNKVNSMRRDAKLDVTDRIQLRIETTERVKHAFELHQNYICHEILANHVEFGVFDGDVLDLNGEPTKIQMQKATNDL